MLASSQRQNVRNALISTELGSPPVMIRWSVVCLLVCLILAPRRPLLQPRSVRPSPGFVPPGTVRECVWSKSPSKMLVPRCLRSSLSKELRLMSSLRETVVKMYHINVIVVDGVVPSKSMPYLLCPNSFRTFPIDFVNNLRFK